MFEKLIKMTTKEEKNMPKWVRLLNALENSREYGNLTSIPVDYHPDVRSIIFTPEQTGYPREQSFETEEGIEYYPIKLGLHVYLVAKDNTKEPLFLQGKKGYENGEHVIQDHAKLYENKELGTEAVSWNKQTIEITKNLPAFLRRVNGLTWTSMRYEFEEDGYHYSGIALMEHSVPFGDKGSTCLCMNNNRECGREGWIRPLILLPTDILVDVKNFDGGPLKIKRGLQEEKVSKIQKRKRTTESLQEKIEAEKALLDELKEKAISIATLADSPFNTLALQRIHLLSSEILSIIDEIEKQNPA